MKKNWVLWLVLAMALTSVACDEEASEEPAIVEDLSPVTLDYTKRGITAWTEDEAAFANKASELSAAFSSLVIRAQIFDELVYSREGNAGISRSRFAARVDTIREAIETSYQAEGVVLVLDLMRLSDGSDASAKPAYLASWDNNDREIERYAFWRDDYRAALLEQIVAAAEAQQPAAFVVGAEMERYLAIEGGEADWTNLVTFYRDAYKAIKEVSPTTKVGLGIDWVRFQLDVVPTLTLTGSWIPEEIEFEEEIVNPEIPCSGIGENDPFKLELERACSEMAFSFYIEPFLQIAPTGASLSEEEREDEVQPEPPTPMADILALAATPRTGDFNDLPENCPSEFFAPLRSWSATYPVYYYAVNWRIDSAVAFSKQQEWVEVLLERNAGVKVELFAWEGLSDLLSNDCGKLTSDLGAPDYLCFKGLFKDSGAPKDSYATFSTDQSATPREE